MKEFKGTKGKWELVREGLQKYIKCGNRYIVEVWFGNEEHNSNAKLIASAPEMFKELKETIIDLKILKNQIIDANKTNHLFDGMPELMEKWIERKEQLLTKITE